MPMYDHDTYDPSLLPPSMRKQDKDLVSLAAILGWKVHLTTNKSVTIISPVNERKKHHFGLAGRSSTNRTRIKKELIKYGDPERVVLAADSLTETDPSILGAIGSVLSSMTEVVDDTPKPEERSQDVNTEEPAPVEPAPVKRHIVDQRPMLASGGTRRSGKNSAYFSATTIERRWSDGSKDYTCAYEECDYSSENRMSPSRHYATTHSKDKAVEQRERFEADVPDRAAYHYSPRDSRVAALAEVIAEMMRAGGRTPEQIARRALEWVHETSHGELSAEREPMTAEEKIARIRVLLDDGTMFSLEKEAQEKADQIAELTRRAEEAEHLLEVRSANLKALRELFDGLEEAAG